MVSRGSLCASTIYSPRRSTIPSRQATTIRRGPAAVSATGAPQVGDSTHAADPSGETVPTAPDARANATRPSASTRTGGLSAVVGGAAGEGAGEIEIGAGAGRDAGDRPESAADG